MEDGKMRKIFITSIFFMTLICFPNLLLADCTDFSPFTSWAVQGDDTIVYYQGRVSVAAITIQDCTVTPKSDVYLPKTFLCDFDTIIVDGEECNILALDLLR